MKIAVVVRQVPDLIEPVEIADSEKAVDLDGATFRANEPDELAMDQAVLIKEKLAGSAVTVVALDFGDVDNTLYTAAAKGADRIVKIPYDAAAGPHPAASRGDLRRGDPRPGGRSGVGGQLRPR